MSGFIIGLYTGGGLGGLLGLIIGWHARHHHQQHKMRMHATKVAMPHIKNLAYTYTVFAAIIVIGALIMIGKVTP